MKLAISVPDPVYRAADRTARRMRLTRSRFYSLAVEAYLRQAGGEDVTARLNAVYSNPEGHPDAFVTAAARRTLGEGR